MNRNSSCLSFPVPVLPVGSKDIKMKMNTVSGIYSRSNVREKRYTSLIENIMPVCRKLITESQSTVSIQ
jgi:hypothetical protein